jgi:GntR family transcriptional regulator, transcriptional repressor for pyruvate dehydrogenase complex
VAASSDGQAASAIGLTRQEAETPERAAAKIFTFFRDQLLSGALKPGDRLLGERELALALGVSRPVLREALRSLAMLGLLDIQQGRGAFVRSPDVSILGQALTLCLAPEPNILDDILQARIAIECQAIRLACERARNADLEAIAATLETLVESLHDPEMGGAADHRFHLGIVMASGSPALIKIYEAIGPLIMRSHVERRRDTFSAPAIRLNLGDAHREVFLSLARRDPDEAERHLRRHFEIGNEIRRSGLIATYQQSKPEAQE